MKKSSNFNFILKDGETDLDVLIKNFQYTLARIKTIYDIYLPSHKITLENETKTLDEKVQKLSKKEQETYFKMIKAVKKGDADAVIDYHEKEQSKELKEIISNTVNNAMIFNLSVDTLREMILVYLIAQFETFLEFLLKTIYLIKPEALKSDKKSILYSDLLENVENVNQYLAEVEAKKMLKLNIDDLARKLDEFVKIDLTKNDSWTKFREYFYRRNLIVHNNAIPDKEYNKKTNNKTIGRVDTSDKYLKESFEIFNKFAILISSHLIKKYAKYAK